MLRCHVLLHHLSVGCKECIPLPLHRSIHLLLLAAGLGIGLPQTPLMGASWGAGGLSEGMLILLLDRPQLGTVGHFERKKLLEEGLDLCGE